MGSSRFSRRSFLRVAGLGVGAAGVSILAACAPAAPTPAATSAAKPGATPAGSAAGAQTAPAAAKAGGVNLAGVTIRYLATPDVESGGREAATEFEQLTGAKVDFALLPTLQLRDYVMADVRHPAPVAGDVILFRIQRYPNVDYIKRLVGLPGDRVQMRRGVLYLNGAAVPRTAIDGAAGRYREILPNGRSYDILQKTENGPLDNTPEFVVPANSLFVLGDNRGDSLDSRAPSQFGFVLQANLVGVAYTVFWSADLSRLLLRIR